jgi:predicted nucleic acid-binding protein
MARPSVYIDTAFLVAVLIRGDTFHVQARQLASDLRQRSLITSDAVLGELLDFVSEMGSHARSTAVGYARWMRQDPRTFVVRHSAELFDRGLALYESRADKGFSLTDCMSMLICEDHNVEEVLTHDHHFTQAGFRILL